MLSEYVTQAEFPRGWKVLKFINFMATLVSPLTNMSPGTSLRLVIYPIMRDWKSSFSKLIDKLCFHLIHYPSPKFHLTWAQLERAFPEKFYTGQCMISLKELASVKRKVAERIDDYLNMFRILKARCFTNIPQHELVGLVVGVSTTPLGRS